MSDFELGFYGVMAIMLVGIGVALMVQGARQ